MNVFQLLDSLRSGSRNSISSCKIATTKKLRILKHTRTRTHALAHTLSPRRDAARLLQIMSGVSPSISIKLRPQTSDLIIVPTTWSCQRIVLTRRHPRGAQPAGSDQDTRLSVDRASGCAAMQRINNNINQHLSIFLQYVCTRFSCGGALVRLPPPPPPRLIYSLCLADDVRPRRRLKTT